MASEYYAPCPELTECNRLIETYFMTGQYQACFQGHPEALERCRELGISLQEKI